VPLGFEAAMVVMKDVLSLKTIRAHVRPMISYNAIEQPDTFVACLAPMLGHTLAREVWKAASRGRWGDLADMRTALLRTLIRRQWTQVASRWRFIAATWKFYRTKPLGVFAVILGPDGSGKTTLAENLCVLLKLQPFKRCEARAMSFGVLPPLGSLVPWRQNTNVEKTEIQHAQRTLGIAHSLVLLLWAATDMAIGRAMLRRKKGQGVFLCHARYFYDYYFQPGHRQTPRWLVQAIERIVAEPDVIYFIDRPAEDIYRDKPELAISEIQEQQNRIKAILSGRPNAVILDGTLGPLETARTAARIVQHRLAQSKF